MKYRTRCLKTLDMALAPLEKALEHAVKPSSNKEASIFHLISLQEAWQWLEMHFPRVHDAAVTIIAADQEETLPLDWMVLLEDWNHTMWILWIMIVLLLNRQASPRVTVETDAISQWAIYINR